MNITLSAEEQVVEEARSWAAAHGTSLNALVRDYLARFGSDPGREAAAGQFAKNAMDGAGRSETGTKFTRGGTYGGRRFEGTQ